MVQVNADAALLDGMENGMTVTVYSNGAMTMSLPGQIGAEKIVKAE
ncbi:unknown [Faecalibacterium sp. CAG:74]|nr:unknown [Faecalibacterium sp. CAG:74]